MLRREPPAKQLQSLTMPAMCPPRRTPFEILRKHGALNFNSWGSSCKLDVFLVPVDSILVRRRFSPCDSQGSIHLAPASPTPDCQWSRVA